LRKHVHFESGKDSLIHITTEDHDPKRASDLANGFVDELYYMNSKLAITEAAQRRVFFDQQLNEEKTALAAAEVDLKNTQEKTGIIQLSGQAESIIRNQAEVQAQIASREVELKSIRTFATDQNPNVTRLQEEIAGLRQQMATMQNDQRTKQIGDIRVPAGQVPEAGLEYARKLRAVKYHDSLFELLSRQFEAARIDEAKSAPLIQVIDRAIPPDKKSGPPRLLIALGSGVGALVLMCLWSVCRHVVLQTLRSPKRAASWQEIRNELGRRHG
jgi:uncharacterized protein involved in exopolysaccharide biosynthesis